MSQMDRHTAENLRERLQDLEEAVKVALKDFEIWLEVDERDGMFDVDSSLKRVILSSHRLSGAWVRNRIK